MNPKKYEYTTVLFSPIRGGVYAGFPFVGKKEFGTNGPVRVECWIDGIHKFCSLLPMGEGQHAIHVKASIRKKIGKQEGDKIKMVVIENMAPKTIRIPDDFQWFLEDDPDLNEKFNQLSFSVRENIVNYINEAKRVETRAKRLDMFIVRIKDGFTRG